MMQVKKFVWALMAIFLSAALASCNIGKAAEPTADVNVIYTSAAQTMIADLNDQQTQTADAVTPTRQSTATSLASATPHATFVVSTGSVPFGTPLIFGTPGTAITTSPSPHPVGTGSYSFPVGCDDAMFIGETKPFDGERVDSGKVFDKGWSLQNTGTCAWETGYSFAFKDGEDLHGDNVRIIQSEEFTDPGHSQAFVITMKAPYKPGEYKGSWQMRNPAGQWFGSIVTIDIFIR